MKGCGGGPKEKDGCYRIPCNIFIFRVKQGCVLCTNQEVLSYRAKSGKGNLFHLCIPENGSVFAFGENKMGQLGLGNQTDAIPSPTQVGLTLFFFICPFLKVD